MATTLVQSTSSSSSNSSPNVNFDQAIEKLAPYRVYLIGLSLAVSYILFLLKAPFGGHSIQDLSQQLAFDNQSPFLFISDWTPRQREWARWELIVDTVFIVLYGLTLITWCWLFANKSLFVIDDDGTAFNTPTARFMKRLGIGIVWLVLVGMLTDSIENSVLILWINGTITSIPAWLSAAWKVVVVMKFLPVLGAIWYILLHPLGILYSFIDLWSGWWGKKEMFTKKRDALQIHAKGEQQHRADVTQALKRQAGPAAPESTGTNPNQQPSPGHPDGPNDHDPDTTDPKKRRFRWLLTFWDSLLGVQFLIYLLVFMFIVINLDQFDEVFFLWLSSTNDRDITIAVVFLILALVCLSAMLYVTSKILLYRRPTKGLQGNDRPEETAKILLAESARFGFVQFLPLLFVALPFVIALVTFVLSDAGLPGNERAAYNSRFISLLAILLVSGICTIFAFRRYARFADDIDILLFVPKTPTQDYASLIRLIPKSILFGQGLLNVLLLIFIPSIGLFTAQAIGLYAVLILWLCVVAYLGTLIIQFNKLPSYPLILGLVVYTVLASQWNDNSLIRQTPNSEALVLSRPTFDAYFDRWYNDRVNLNPADTLGIPVVMIATEGGGIRAAAWTTACMHQLDSLIPGFNRYVFGLSGVSGGGVGAATYIALQRANQSANDTLPALVGSQAQDVVSRDLIAPTVASMLFRGGVHNFSPLPIPFLDRNHWLEDAWENAVFNHIPNNSVRQTLEHSFVNYYDTTLNSTRLPLLFLNSSVAETGQKAILSPLNLENTPVILRPYSSTSNQQSKESHFYDVVDLFAVTKTDIPFKTAAFLCARFPFVTSGGRVEGQLPNLRMINQNDHPSFHLIDGGYVENTGIMTGVQIIRRLQQLTLNPKNSGKYRVRYYLISLHSGQQTDNAPGKTTLRFLSEPLSGFLNAAGRQGFGLDQLVAYTLQDPAHTARQPNNLKFTYLNISLDREKGHPYPLGWYLSPMAANALNTNAQQQLGILSGQQPLSTLKNYIKP